MKSKPKKRAKSTSKKIEVKLTKEQKETISDKLASLLFEFLQKENLNGKHQNRPYPR